MEKPKPVLERASKDALKELGGSWPKVFRNITLLVVALVIVRFIGGWQQMIEESRWIISSLLTIGGFFLLVFLVKLIQAPIHIRYEKEKTPRLSVYETYKEKYSATDCRRVGLVIRNEGTDTLNNCHARLIGIDFETPSSKSSYEGVPVNKDIPCDSTIGGQSNGKAQAMTCHGLLGHERAIIEYLDKTSRGIFLAWRQPILLLLHIWGGNSSPIYAVCKVSKQTIGLDICVLESAPLQHDIKLSDFQTITPDK